MTKKISNVLIGMGGNPGWGGGGSGGHVPHDLEGGGDIISNVPPRFWGPERGLFFFTCLLVGLGDYRVYSTSTRIPLARARPMG